MDLTRFELWELHGWRSCDVCGLDDQELTEPYELERSVHVTDGGPIMETVTTAPPIARFLTPTEAREVFADQLVTITRHYQAVEVTALGSSEPVYVKGRLLPTP